MSETLEITLEEVFGSIKPQTEDGEFPTLKPGRYTVMLAEIKPCYVQDFEDKTKRHPGLRFVFQHEESGAYIGIRCKASVNSRSNNYRIVKALAGGSLPPEAQSDPKIFQAITIEQIGKYFSVPVTLSEDGKWNNIDEIGGIIPTSAPAKPATTAQQTTGFEGMADLNI